MATKKAKSKLERRGQKLGVTPTPGESSGNLARRIHEAIALNSAPKVIKTYKVNGLNLAELRAVPRTKGKPKPDRLYIYVNRGNMLNIFSIHNVSNVEIQTAISQGAYMFDEGNPDAEEFQNLCFAELARRM